jgi:GntR family transcriptional regulator
MRREGFRRIAGELRERILSGDLPPGAQIPTTKELVTTYRTTVVTVRRAIEELTKEGLVEGRQPVGTFVRNEHREVLEICRDDQLSAFSPPPPSVSDRFLAAYATDGKPFSQTLDIRTAVPPDGVAHRLGAPGEPVLLRHRVLYAGKERISIANTYVPLHVAAGTPMEQPSMVENDLVALLDEAGFPVDVVDEEMFVRPASALECTEMGWDTGQHLLGQMFTARSNDRPVACWVSLMPSVRCILARRYRMKELPAVRAAC